MVVLGSWKMPRKCETWILSPPLKILNLLFYNVLSLPGVVRVEF